MSKKYVKPFSKKRNTPQRKPPRLEGATQNIGIKEKKKEEKK